MKRLHKTKITAWPAITDLMTTIVVIAVLSGVVGYSHMKDESRGFHQRLNYILAELDSTLKESGVSVDVLRDEGILRFSHDAINFEFGEVEPINEHKANVGVLAQTLAKIVPCYISPEETHTDDANFENDNSCRKPVISASSCSRNNEDCQWVIGTILIEGHTDSAPVREGHRFENNLELSSMRAASVYDMMIAFEPSIKEMRNARNVPIFSTSGYGEKRLAIPADSLNDYNRRIDIRLLLEPRKKD